MESKIRCQDVWKVFGPEPEKMIRGWDSYKDMTKVARLKQTGCVVGARNASFQVEEGEIYCLMGLSGSGKSTLLRCINRLHEPSQGQVFVDDQEITALSPQDLREMRRKKTGMVFQHFALLPHRRIIKNVAFGLEIQGVDKNERENKALEVLELVGLKGWEQSYPYELSGGMQQRVGLARALATDPEILLMDEAFSALDPLIRRQMQDEFVKLIKQVKKTIVFVTHDLNEALRIATHIAIMKDGEIAQQGTPSEIVLHPENEYVEDFVRDLPKIKFITANDIMVKPERWLVDKDESVAGILRKMDKEYLRFVFVVGEDQRVRGVLDYFRMAGGEEGAEYLDNPPPENTILTEFPTAESDTFLEDLLNQAAETQIPIVIRDRQERVIGIANREKLLVALTTA